MWYEKEVDTSQNLSPQEIQMKYPEIDLLISDLKSTNKHMIEYKKLMGEIAFKK